MEKHTNPSMWRRAEDCPILTPEAAKDCILPDSYPDIHKILYTSATCAPGRILLSGGKIQAEGVLYCQVLFADEEERLHAVRYSLEYSGQMPYAPEEGEVRLSADSTLETLTARALNPRKLSLRGKITVTPSLFYRCPEEPALAPELSSVLLEKKLQTFPCWQLGEWRESGIEASEDLSLGENPPIGELIYSDLVLTTDSCTAGEGEVRFAGSGLLHLFYRTAEGALRYANIGFPFESSAQGEITPDAFCKVRLIPERLSVVPTEDAAGEARGVELDFTYTLEVTAAIRQNCTRPSDCYSVETATEAREETVSLLSGLRPFVKEFTRHIEGDSEGMTEVLKAFARVWVDAKEKGERGQVLHCTAQTTLIGLNADGAPLSVQLMENFPLETDADEVICLAITAEPTAAAEGDKLRVRLVGKASGFAVETGAVTYVGEVLPAAERTVGAEDSMTLCYPAPGETLWDIAKRYRIPQSALLSANTIPEGVLPRVLLIPR